MQRWTVIRTTLIAATFMASAFMSQDPRHAEDLPIPFLIAVFVFGVVGMLFVIGIQRINPWSAKFWRYPNWSINPFQMREPLQFFHFGGHFMLASGAGSLMHQIFTGSPSLVISSMPLVFGLGILGGVHACTVVYQNKMVRSHPVEKSQAR